MFICLEMNNMKTAFLFIYFWLILLLIYLFKSRKYAHMHQKFGLTHFRCCFGMTVEKKVETEIF